jgi:hypothetical protein
MFPRNVVDFQRTIRRYIPEDSILLNHRCENLKSYFMKIRSVALQGQANRRTDTARTIVRSWTVTRIGDPINEVAQVL